MLSLPISSPRLPREYWKAVRGRVRNGTPFIGSEVLDDLGGTMQRAMSIASPWRSLLSVFILTAGASAVLAQPAAAQPAAPPKARDLAAYRAQFPTKLTRHGPAPEIWQGTTLLKLPDGVREVEFESDGLKLKAWVTDAPQDGKLRPALVYCHGGFWFGNDDWDVLKPFVDAGFIVMAPRW